MSAIRVGLVGIGMMGRNHARVLHGIEGIDLVAVADPAGDKFGVAGDAVVVSTVEEMIKQGIDAAVVAVPTIFHLEAGLELAAAGVHTLIEKPLAPSPADAEQLVSAFESADLVNAVGHIERCNPALRALRARLEQGDLGDLYQVATRRQGPFPNRIADVGVVKDLATHDIDLTAWVIQSPYARVAAYTAHKSGREHEDLISISAQMQDGTVASHLVNWLSPLEGADHHRHRGEGRLCRRHSAWRPDLPRERTGGDRVGPGRHLPWGVRGQQHTLRHSEA